MILTKDHLWGFLQREALVDGVVELFGELEFSDCLTSFSIAPCITERWDSNARQGQRRQRKSKGIALFVRGPHQSCHVSLASRP